MKALPQTPASTMHREFRYSRSQGTLVALSILGLLAAIALLLPRQLPQRAAAGHVQGNALQAETAAHLPAGDTSVPVAESAAPKVGQKARRNRHSVTIPFFSFSPRS